jgi:mono/diheme cytochrome c family protein
MRTFATAALTLVVLATGGTLFILSGLYDMGADAPHWPATYRLLAELRDRSIARASADIAVPGLSNHDQVSKGAGQYAAMCAGCHLSPGVTQSELRSGLYPQPPNLSAIRIPPAQAFWAIKHGIKMSAMPAWGSNHDDATIWSMVSFLQTLPNLNAEQYRKIVAEAPPDEDMDMQMEMKPPTGRPGT